MLILVYAIGSNVYEWAPWGITCLENKFDSLLDWLVANGRFQARCSSGGGGGGREKGSEGGERGRVDQRAWPLPLSRCSPLPKGSGEGAKLFALRASVPRPPPRPPLRGRRESAKLFALRAARSANLGALEKRARESWISGNNGEAVHLPCVVAHTSGGRQRCLRGRGAR